MVTLLVDVLLLVIGLTCVLQIVISKEAFVSVHILVILVGKGIRIILVGGRVGEENLCRIGLCKRSCIHIW